uniref:Otolin-1-A-like n=2 Tax=Petromyzon marinus TaxID=7757 RepID=A0AAJ7UDB5_PETMA|nr:otolin-1-A-like [Petromyzon marinus]
MSSYASAAGNCHHPGSVGDPAIGGIGPTSHSISLVWETAEGEEMALNWGDPPKSWETGEWEGTSVDDDAYMAKGERGEKGEVGEMGIMGARGTRGEKGDKGEKGEALVREENSEETARAEKGESGEKGEPGARGETGLRGERGAKGDIGPSGKKGETGAWGEQGETGPAGESGAMGVPGMDGPRGPRGEKGETGPRGPRGEKGETGPRGGRGADGAHAKKGEKGEDGERGEPGPPGIQGPPNESQLTDAFSAKMSHEVAALYSNLADNPPQSLTFDSVLTNTRHSYDPEEGHFTCVEEGAHFFSFHVLPRLSMPPLRVKLVKNESPMLVVSSSSSLSASSASSSLSTPLSGSTVLMLRKGDQVWLSAMPSSNGLHVDEFTDCCFTGYRL